MTALNMKYLWKNERQLFIMIVLIQAVSIFAVLFVRLALTNNNLVSQESYFDTMTLWIEMYEGTDYSEFEEALFDISKGKLNGLIDEYSVVCEIEEDDEEIYYSFEISKFKIKDGHYAVGNYMKNTMSKQMLTGRIFTDDELQSSNRIAITYAYPYDEVVIDDVTFDVIGEMSGSAPNLYYVYVVPNVLKGRPVSSVEIMCTRIPNDAEKNAIAAILNEYIPNGFYFSESELSDESDKSTQNAVKLAQYLILFVAAGTMIVLYVYMFENMRYRMSVCRLVGCSFFRSVMISAFETLIISMVSLFVGILTFAAASETLLPYVYKYTPGIVNLSFFSGSAAVFFAVAVIMSVVFSTTAGIKSIHFNLSV